MNAALKTTSGSEKRILEFDLSAELHHGVVVSNLAYAVAEELGLPHDQCYQLAIAGMLHDIGKYVNLNDPGKNGYQLIISTEIMGLSHREREEVANIVLYNTQELPDTDELDTAFWREEYLRIAKLSSILRLANALDRGHKQKLEKCSMARKGKELIISLETNQDITLEITRFSKKAETFSEFTGITPVLKQKRAL